jgi:hypothetical protein
MTTTTQHLRRHRYETKMHLVLTVTEYQPEQALWRARHRDQLAPVSAIKAINEIGRESVSDPVGPELFA